VVYDDPHLLSVWAAGNDRDDLFQNIHQTLYGGDSIYVTWLEADPSTIVGGQYQGPGYYPVLNAGATLAPGPDEEASDGYDTLTPEASAKNNLVVGAVDDVLPDPYGVGDIVMSDFSSWGATDDGRVKVDLVANGVDVYSTGASANDAYFTDSGTSMAAPNVTGTAALLIEHYEDLFLDRPLAATTKGLLIHTAFDAGNTGPDYAYGWGLVDAAAAANLLTDAAGSAPSSWVAEDTYDGTTYDCTLISDGSGPLKATICWTDPAGPAQGSGLDDTTSVLVNDLDLWLTGPDGTTYYPWTLDPANPANPAVRTTGNHLDNVEQVLIDAPGAGTYTIHIGGALDPAYSDQDYSLLVSGAADAVYGSQQPDTLELVRDAGDPDLASLTVNAGTTYSLYLPDLTSLEIETLEGDDTLEVDYTYGTPLPTGGLNFNGGAGTDTLEIVGRAVADTVACTTTQATVNGSDIDHTAVENLVLALDGGENAVEVVGGFGLEDLTVLGGGGGSYTFEADDPDDTASLEMTLASAADVTFETSLRLETLTLSDTSVGTLATSTGTSRFIKTESLSIAESGGTPTATLDLTNNNLIIDYDEESGIDDVAALIKNAFSGGAWNGTGITCDGNASEYGLGFADNADEDFATKTYLEGEEVDETSVLVRYTFYGNANLDDRVDSADMSKLLGNYGETMPNPDDIMPWWLGNFNYDDRVDSADLSKLLGNWGKTESGA
jgi:hypothetical protein